MAYSSAWEHGFLTMRGTAEQRACLSFRLAGLFLWNFRFEKSPYDVMLQLPGPNSIVFLYSKRRFAPPFVFGLQEPRAPLEFLFSHYPAQALARSQPPFPSFDLQPRLERMPHRQERDVR